jgi:phospholipase/carboxylesterase
MCQKSVLLPVITISPPPNQLIRGNVVIMHGWGATAEDAAYFSSLLDLPNVQLILPEGPFPHPYSPIGRMWYGLPDPLYDFQFQADLSDSVELQTSRRLIHELLSELPGQTGVPLAKTIVGGFSQGAAMAIDVGLDLPLAGLMVLSGYLHQPLVPRSPAPSTQPIASTLTAPILQVHGTIDPVVPLAAAQATRDALHAIGLTVQYQEIPGMGHEIAPPVLAQMQDFIQTQLALV